MKNSLKRAASLIALGAVAASACSLNAFAEGSKFSPDGGFSADEIANSAVQPKLTATQKVITLDEASKTQTIVISVSGADAKYASTGMHIYYDKRLEVEKNRFDKPVAGLGAAGEYLTTKTPDVDPTAADFDMEGIFVTTAGENDYGLDGELITINVTIEKPEAGAVYPIDIIYRSNATNEDLFVNKAVDQAGKLMQAYTWTQGIYNTEFNNNFKADADDVKLCPALANIAGNMDGYIAIAGGEQPTDPPVDPTEPPTEPPTTPPTTPPTEPPTETATSAASTFVTTETTVASTVDTTASTSADATTTAKKTTAKKTTAKKTTAKKDDSPKTGVAGAGVAVAGLAVALGTAFVLRKKED